MFRITEDPSSGSLIQCLAKITSMVISCLLTWTWSVLWQHILTRGSLYRKAFLYSELRTHALWVRICCHKTDHVHVNGHDRTILVILAKHCTRLPDDGSSVTRNMLEHFQIF